MILPRVLRWAAVALAVVAIADPRVPLPRREHAAVRVSSAGADAATRDRAVPHLAAAGFPIAADGESAWIVTAGAPLPATLTSTPIYVLREDAGAADVSIVSASASSARVAEQAVAVMVTVHARGGVGATTTIRLEDGGLAVASAAHTWSAPEETWRTSLSYLPAGSGALRLRVRADTLPGERRTADNAVDLLAPAIRGPVRTLTIEPGVSWPAAFVRRALEASPAFAVSAVQHATKTVATRAGAPPRGITRSDLAPYEAVVIGQPESLDAAGLDALRWFVEQRGGLAVFVPDRTPEGGYVDMAGGVGFDAKTLEAPVTLGGTGAGIMATELAVPRAAPPLSFPLATDAAGAPIVFGLRRGMGAVIVSGALDAWRYRDRNDGAFARFWRGVILQQASMAPPPLEVTAIPSLARPGDNVRVTVRLRGIDMPAAGDRMALPPATARVVNPRARTETVIRLWPSAEPGVYEGEWRPSIAGDYAVDASIGTANGAAILDVAPDAAMPAWDSTTLSIAAGATGGALVDGEAALVRTLSDRFPTTTVMRPIRVARSPWYAATFTLLLCGEWAIRRRRGSP
jgi:hypothetical protein